MATIYGLIDAVLIQFGTGYCPHCRRIRWCHLLWNNEQQRFNPACPGCTPDELGVTHERYYAMLEESEEDPMTRGQLIYTLIGLMLIATLYSFAFTWWGAHDPRIGKPFMVWVATPVVNLVAIGMTYLQIRFYKQGQERKGNS